MVLVIVRVVKCTIKQHGKNNHQTKTGGTLSGLTTAESRIHDPTTLGDGGIKAEKDVGVGEMQKQKQKQHQQQQDQDQDQQQRSEFSDRKG